MRIVEEVAPAVEPVTVAELKTFLRIDHNDDDSTLALLISSARQKLEHATQRAFIERRYRLTLDAFPPRSAIELVRLPVQSVYNVQYYDPDGNLQTLPPTRYMLDNAGDLRAWLVIDQDGWPDTDQNRANAVAVRYVSGYGTTAAQVPAVARMAIMRAAAAEYAGREANVYDSEDISSLLIPR